MGPLTLPARGAVYVDANAIIYSVERIEPYRELLAPMWEEARVGRFTLASSELVAIGNPSWTPARRTTLGLEMLFRSILRRCGDGSHSRRALATWEDAARIRAETGLATPDALHAATALGALAALHSSPTTPTFAV